MKEIDLNNYEEFALDFIEGNLSAQEKTAMEIFLSQHPAIRDEINELASFTIDTPNISYPYKNDLKKNIIQAVGKINEKNYEDFFIAYHENILSSKETQLVVNFLGLNNFLEKDFNQFANSRLTPTKIDYPHKNKLKKANVIWLPLFSGLTAVAALLLLFFNINLDGYKANIKNTKSNLANVKQVEVLNLPTKTVAIPLKQTAIVKSTKEIAKPVKAPVTKATKTIQSKPILLLQPEKAKPSIAKLAQIPVKSIDAHAGFIIDDLYYRYTYSKIVYELELAQKSNKNSFFNKLFKNINKHFQNSQAGSLVELADTKIIQLIKQQPLRIKGSGKLKTKEFDSESDINHR